MTKSNTRENRTKTGVWGVIHTDTDTFACHVVELNSKNAFIEVPPNYKVTKGILVFQHEGTSAPIKLSFKVQDKIYWETLSPLGEGTLRAIEIRFDGAITKSTSNSQKRAADKSL